ncbi:MAG: shikimate kinase [Deltaproteobacteria bacterium]|nr:shikimate kinase [Deltaproteobacteria bacterium]MBW2317233.1 shikimate kinase [Deltaproteobacteria bacterium]OEU44975.1 MAG: hypothetical protein BBJ60_07305 [Desulfobacterales bacterium S7086C20]
MNIVLIGYRGTGKTAVGRALAERLKRLFYDADVFLEEKLATTIAEMVAKEGWNFFREKEKEVIRELSAKEDSVIATGGGAVMDRENVGCLKKNGFFILLTADIDTMVQRILADDSSTGQRPELLDSDIYRETKTLIEQRMPLYEEIAHFSIDTTKLSVAEVTERIIGISKIDGLVRSPQKDDTVKSSR